MLFWTSAHRPVEVTMTEQQPVVFIHGLWLHATSWLRWVDLFAAHGYAAAAPGWPGEELTVAATRENRGALSGRFSQVVGHYAGITAGLRARPVLIGHGFGGLLALRMAAEIHAAGVIAIDALPATAMALPGRLLAGGQGTVALSREEFRVVYGSALSREESDRLHDLWAIPAPERVLREEVFPDAVTQGSGAGATNSSRGPTLFVASGLGGRVGGGQNPSAERGPMAAASDVVVFADRGPSLILDSGWRQVAQSCLSWMDAQEL